MLFATADKSEAVFCDPSSMKESIDWRNSGEALSVAKVQELAKKIIAIIFKDTQGIVIVNFKLRTIDFNGLYFVKPHCF